MSRESINTLAYRSTLELACTDLLTCVLLASCLCCATLFILFIQLGDDGKYAVSIRQDGHTIKTYENTLALIIAAALDRVESLFEGLSVPIAFRNCSNYGSGIGGCWHRLSRDRSWVIGHRRPLDQPGQSRWFAIDGWFSGDRLACRSAWKRGK